jgi:hypothetical protein
MDTSEGVNTTEYAFQDAQRPKLPVNFDSLNEPS